jgi:integrase
MPRKRTGTLVEKPSGFFAKMWITREGVTRREWINLETTDRTLARRKMAKLQRMLDEGQLVAEAKAAVQAPETVASYALSWCERREAAGIVMARDEKHNLEAHVLPVTGKTLALARFNDSHAADVLEAARDKGLGHETVRKIRAVMSRMFKRARKDKLVAINPIDDVEMPEGLKKDKRPRVILSDDEIRTYLAAPKCDLELKMLVLVARTEGGMRTSELVRWDWSMLDRIGFAFCSIPRAKTGEIQALEIPDVLRAFLRAWWVRAGSPSSGPVFPVRRGENRGGFKKGRGTSFAHRLRRDLFRAGAVRAEAVRGPKNTLLPNPADPLFFDTKVSRKVDFHSCRRAFNTALAEAGVNVQHAMHLASHSDAKTHMGYVMHTEAMKRIPVAAMPVLDPHLAGILSPPVTKRAGQASAGNGIPSDSQYARSDSNGRHSASKADALSS